MNQEDIKKRLQKIPREELNLTIQKRELNKKLRMLKLEKIKLKKKVKEIEN